MKKININLKFWLKNLLYFYTPGGYGYYRFLKSHRDSNIKSYRDLYPSDFNSEWKDYENGNYSSRRYDSYQTYISHQASKFHALIKKKGGFSNRTVLDYRLIFYRRFCYLSKYLAKSAKILCAGARQGTEVEVLRDLGFYNATGIDLNPGPSNPLVSNGDFMHLEYENDSLDLIYSNSIDHAFDFESMLQEHARAIKPDGYVLYEMYYDQNDPEAPGGFETVAWKSDEVIFSFLLKHFNYLHKVEMDSGWKWVLLQGKRTHLNDNAL